MGRNKDPRTPDLLDHYDPYEGPLVSVIDSLLKCDYDVTTYHVIKEIGTDSLVRYQILSSKLVSLFNSYYDFEPSGSTYDGQVVATGKLKNDIFKNKDGKLAFLAGAYVRFGLPNDTAYLINVGNSLSKAQVCFKLLKQYHCKPSYQIINNIPSIHQVYFHPNPEVKNYLKKYMYLRKALMQSEKAFVNQIISKRKHKR